MISYVYTYKCVRNWEPNRNLTSILVFRAKKDPNEDPNLGRHLLEFSDFMLHACERRAHGERTLLQ